MAREATHGGLLAGGKRGRVKEAATREEVGGRIQPLPASGSAMTSNLTD